LRLVEVDLVGSTSRTVGVCGGGGLWWSARFRAQLDILRLITRGLERNRRGGSSRSVTSRRLWVMDRASLEGGKRRLPGDVAAHDAQGAGEGDPVGIVSGFEGGLVHEFP
jgi:hypothetical protein